jgi:hypothetical protein
VFDHKASTLMSLLKMSGARSLEGDRRAFQNER